MRQALHIFKKDIRYLRGEIVLLIGLSAIFVWSATDEFSPRELIEPALMLAAGYLIVRLIHAEAIPGEKQFWATRPYRSGSLLAAKLLFIVVVVNLPIFVARLFILILSGFPLLPNLPGLLWSQGLLMVTTFLPIAAIASLTSGIVQFVFAAFVLWMSVSFGIVWLFTPATQSRWLADEWVRFSIADLLLLAVVSSILTMQYRNRRTVFNCVFAIAASLVGFAVFWNLPVAFLLNTQSWLSKQPSVSAPIQIAIEPSLKKTNRLSDARLVPSGVGTEVIQIDVPLLLKGVQEGHEVWVDAIEIAIEGGGGETRKFDLTGVTDHRFIDNVYESSVFIDASFFNNERERPVTIRASAYLTVFGNGQERTFSLQEERVNVTDALQCFRRGEYVRFRAAIRMPDQLIYARIGRLFIDEVGSVSYSPFPAHPAEVTLNPVSVFKFGPPASGSEVTIISREPLEHFRREVELRGASLANFAVVPN